jgi:cobalt-zinc-cadmium efflux system membrane fusion protein
MTMIKLSYLLITLLSLTATAWAEPQKKEAQLGHDTVVLASDSPQLAKLKIMPAEQVPEAAADALNGRVTLDEDHTARLFSPVLGRAIRIGAKIGDSVKSGQVLMQMDSPDLGSAVADTRKAEADLAMKKKALERSKLLYEHGVIAQKDLESTQSDFSQSEAEAIRAQGRLNNLGGIKGGENYTVRSPISGVVVDRQVNPGMEVRPDAQNPLFTITDPNHLWAVIDLPERDLAKVHANQNITLEVDAYPGESFTGKVLSIGTLLDPATRRIPVRCVVDSKGGRLKPEMYARITPLSDSQRMVVRIPNTALVTDGLYNYVFVETAPGRLQKRRIDLGEQSREYTVAKEGLKAGEKIVTVGAILLNASLAEGK